MGAYKSAIITTAGQNLIAQALAGGSAVKFTALKTSNYSYPASTNFEALTSLQGVKQSTGITSAIVVNQTTVKISARVSNVGITSAYYINTIGVYAETDGITETLIAVVPASTADLVPAYSTGAPYSFIYDINLTIQNSTSLNVTINDSGVATVADLQHFYEKTYDVYVTDTASGEIASFEDGADKIPMESVNVSMTPRQSFNGYDEPWPSGGGKNLFDSSVFPSSSSQNIIYLHYAVPNGAYTMSTPDFPLVGGIANVFFLAGSVSSGISSGSNGVSTSMPRTITVTDGYYTVAYRSTNDINTNNPKDFKWQIESGDSTTSYSPYSNICPISGWTGAEVMRTGVNVCDEVFELGAIVNGNNYSSNNNLRTKNYIPVVGGQTFYSTCPSDIILFQYDKDKTLILQGNTPFITVSSGASFVVTAGTRFIRFYIQPAYGTTYNHDISINYPSSDHDYHAYNGNTYTIPFTTTVYGGTVDIANGELTVTDANIVSYNGETLPGEWLSSYDKYAEGATPTTGAQVVYKLATPQTIQLSPTEIDSLYGYNNVWSDIGNISVKYRADTTLYIDKKIAETQALILENS